MPDVVRTAIIGFVSGLAGAMLVLWVMGPDESPGQPNTQDDTGQAELHTPAVPVADPVPDELPRFDAIEQTNEVLANNAPEPQPAVAEETLSKEDRYANYARKQQEQIATKLREAGWSEAEIAGLDEMQQAAGLEMEERMHKQMRVMAENNPQMLSMLGQSSILAEQMGEDRYEQYREALGRPTSVPVRNVIKGSAAEIAGLQPGDKIRRYGTKRVYDEQDVIYESIQGKYGESITIEVDRDGMIFHATVPRGPLGTSSYGRRID